VPRGSTKAWLEKRRQKEGGETGARNGDTRGEADREDVRRRAAASAAAAADKDHKDDDDDFTAVRAAVSRSGGAPPGACQRARLTHSPVDPKAVCGGREAGGDATLTASDGQGRLYAKPDVVFRCGGVGSGWSGVGRGA
jgi:hypothetical protein